MRARLLQVFTRAEDDFFGIEEFARGVGGTVLGAASALDAGKCLERGDLGKIFAGIEAKVFVADERRDFAEAVSLQKHRQRTEHEVHVLGAGDQRKKSEKNQRVRPPDYGGGSRPVRDPEARKIRDHQRKDEEGDQTGFGERGSSHLGRMTKRRKARPAMEMETATARIPAIQK